MTEIIKILVVEDTDDMFELYEDQARELGTNALTISLTRAKTVDEGKQRLLSNEYDGAIVDLNLSQTDPREASGNDILIEIIEKHRFPVFVVSGNLGNLKPEIRAKSSNFLKFFDRTVSNTDIFNGIIAIFKTGITKILGGRGIIEQQLSDIFWKHLSSEINGSQVYQTEKVLLRHIVSHLLEYLDLPEEDDGGYHESEVYIRPPIRDHISSGDIIEMDGKFFVVLSPACDVAVRKPVGDSPIINSNRITLAPTIPVERQAFIENKIIKDGDNAGARSNVLSEIIKGKREKYGFLPKYGDIAPAVIDFQNIISISFTEYLTMPRLATISGFFMKDIQSRFAAYVGRQGQPDLDKTRLLDEYRALISPP